MSMRSKFADLKRIFLEEGPFPDEQETRQQTSTQSTTPSARPSGRSVLFDRALCAAQESDASAEREAMSLDKKHATTIRTAVIDWLASMSIAPVEVVYTGVQGGVDIETINASWILEGKPFRGHMLLTGSYGSLQVQMKVDPVYCMKKGLCQNCPHESWEPVGDLASIGRALRKCSS